MQWRISWHPLLQTTPSRLGRINLESILLRIFDRVQNNLLTLITGERLSTSERHFTVCHPPPQTTDSRGN